MTETTLEYVEESDKILIISMGVSVEYGSFQNLLNK